LCTISGVLVFQREADAGSTAAASAAAAAGGGGPIEQRPVMEVFVAGDTAYNTWALLTNRVSDRPMVHDLMWQVWFVCVCVCVR
jgi:hypothetical protein